MLELVNELLDSNVIESGKVNLKFVETNILEIINIILYQQNSYAIKKNQKINFRFDNNHEYISFCDPLKIREAFENLISNAIKYSPTDKEINIILEFDKIQNKLRFSVIDQGPGFSEEDKKKLFRKFQRLTAQPTGGEKSTGLGLYITQQIISHHNGVISLESELGKGACFRIELNALNFDTN